jgi:signal transduction histidine kinase
VIRGDATIRRAINELSAPPAADVESRLASMIATVESEFLVEAGLDVSSAAATSARRLGEATVNAIVKVAREALVNAAKHARPCHVQVGLHVAGRNRLRVAVSDTGPGITSNGNGRHGLTSIRSAVEECGGVLKVSSPPGGGTRVEATFPVPAAAPSSDVRVPAALAPPSPVLI